MPTADALKWDARYRERILRVPPEPHRLLVEHAGLLPSEGLAVDIACGLGTNAGFLLDHGLRVICVDISQVALQEAKRRQPALMTVAANLNRFYLPPATFDVILNFYYLQRDLWPAYRASLRPGGLLFFETYLRNRTGGKPVKAAYLLVPGELQTAFASLEILAYDEGERDDGSGAVAAMVARKPFGRDQ